jgi:hypothetical protein
MAYRRKTNRRRDGKYFSKTASRSHKKNFGSTNPMRGGIRL